MYERITFTQPIPSHVGTRHMKELSLHNPFFHTLEEVHLNDQYLLQSLVICPGHRASLQGQVISSTILVCVQGHVISAPLPLSLNQRKSKKLHNEIVRFFPEALVFTQF